MNRDAVALLIAIIFSLALGATSFAVRSSDRSERIDPRSMHLPITTEAGISEKMASAATSGGSGAIEGVLNMVMYGKKKGNMFLFVLDQDYLPEENYVLAHKFMSVLDLTADKVPFRVEDVPPGTWSVIAVWDTAAPYCVVTEPFCQFSGKDGLGMSNPVSVQSGVLVNAGELPVY